MKVYRDPLLKIEQSLCWLLLGRGTTQSVTNTQEISWDKHLVQSSPLHELFGSRSEGEDDKLADLSPKNIFRNNPPQMVPTDLNIGFQGLALIQGQIYNPGWWSSNMYSICHFPNWIFPIFRCFYRWVLPFYVYTSVGFLRCGWIPRMPFV